MSHKKSIFVNIRNGQSYLTETGLDKSQGFRLKTLNLLEDFVYGGSYTKYRNKDLFLSMETYDDKFIARKLNMTVAGVRQTRKRLSEEVYNLLGNDVIERILYGDEHACELVSDNIMLLKTSSNEEFVLSEIKERLVNAYIGDGSSEFNLRDCKNEMTFLSLFTISRFSSLVEKLDSEKLNYIIRLLDGQVKNVDDRFIALKYMTSNKSLEELFNLLRESSNSIKN